MTVAEIETLWERVIGIGGRVYVEKQEDAKGEYVLMRIDTLEGERIFCSSASVPAGLRGLVRYLDGEVYRIEMLIPGGVWRTLPGKSYINEWAAEKAVDGMKAKHPVCQFRVRGW